MKFRKFGKALLMSTLSVGAVLSVTSCVQSYTVGFLYVTGTDTAKNGAGIVSGFKIDHNTGQLVPINGLPVSSGGANPGRAVILQGSRFVYVLNRGVDASGGDDCTSNTSPCTGSNITLFTVGGNGGLSPQPQQFTTQGNNPFRILADASGSYVMVLDHDAPDSGVGASNSCSLALGSGVTTCGDITIFKVDPTTGRLSLILNSQVSSATGQPLPYFPVPADPIDFILAGSNYVLTLAGNPTDGDLVFPYSFTNGQLTISQNGAQSVNTKQATAIQSGNGSIYILDAEPLTINCTTNCTFPAGTYAGQLVPFSIATGGALQAETGGPVPVDPSQSNPQFLLVENKNKWVYVADAGDNQNKSNPQSGLTGYDIDTQSKQLIPMSGSPFNAGVGIGAGPQCLVEDPSNQFIYTANFNDSTVTGVVLNQIDGTLSKLPGKAAKAYSLPGPAAYCIVNGRTS